MSAIVQGVFYCLAGRAHFTNPEFYLRIMPPALPYPAALVALSGAAEIAGGLGLLVPATRTYAAWGLVALLVAVFPANVYHWWSGGAGMDIPLWALRLRLPFQGVFLAWAYWHTRP